MILLDTNVVSEPWKPEPDPQVVAWIDAQAVETLYLSAITVAELRFGIALLPAGKRRSILHDRLEQDVLPVFSGRVVPFDLPAAGAYAALMSKVKASGRSVSMADGYIAAIAIAQGFQIATRDVSPFQRAGISVINPWTA